MSGDTMPRQLDPRNTLRASPPPGAVRVLHILPALFGGGMEWLVMRLMRAQSWSNQQADDAGRIEHGLCALRDADAALLEESRRTAATWVLNQKPTRNRRSDRLACLRLRQLIRHYHPDVVHALSTGAWLDAVAATVGLRHVRLVLAFHGRTSLAPSSWLRRQINGLAARQADAVLTVSREAAASLRCELGIPSHKLRTIPNGVDPDLYHPAATEDQRRTVRSTLGASDNACVVICVANLMPIKGLDVMLHAWRRLQMADRLARLLIVGDGPLRESLTKLARQLRCDGSVRFLGARQDVPELLRAADLFVLPSRYEACSLAVLEAMACGLPVVTTTAGGLPELITANETGWLVPPDDVERLFGTIYGALQDRATRERIGRAARAEALRRFTLDLCVRRYASLFRELAGSEASVPTCEPEGIACAG